MFSKSKLNKDAYIETTVLFVRVAILVKFGYRHLSVAYNNRNNNNNNNNKCARNVVLSVT